MTAVCILMNVKPGVIKDPNSGKKMKDYWVKAKVILGDSRLLQNLVNYDKENMNDDMIDEVKKYTDDPNFDPEIVKKGSVAAAGLCKWVHAMVIYYEVSQEVGPKRDALAEAKGQLSEAQELLYCKQAQLHELLNKLSELQLSLDAAEAKKNDLESQVSDCKCKLQRAEQLINGLGGEQKRWEVLSNSLAQLYHNAVGDILLSSGAIALAGPFTSLYRAKLLQQWTSILRSMNVTCSKDFALSRTLGNPVKIREWIIHKLPNDSLSIDNAIMLEKSELW